MLCHQVPPIPSFLMDSTEMCMAKKDVPLFVFWWGGRVSVFLEYTLSEYQ